jgi:acyl-coenzyme A thioesterase 13
VSAAAEFAPYERTSPFFDLVGPLLCRRSEDGIQFALSIDTRHLNARGAAHGGVLAALADVALGYTAALQRDPPARLITASLTIDFAGAVSAGELVVATVDVQRVGSRMAFANCYLSCDDRRVARAVFANASATGGGAGSRTGGANVTNERQPAPRCPVSCGHGVANTPRHCSRRTG